MSFVTAGDPLTRQYFRGDVHVHVPREMPLGRLREWIEHTLKSRRANPAARVVVCVELGSDPAYQMGLHDA